MVDTLAARATPAAVLTNKPGTVARRILDALGIRERFTAVVGDGDGFPRKPDPTSLRSLITTAGAKRPLYVGDSHVDAETASRAGIEFVFVEYGYGAALGDFRRIARFADLP